MVLDVVHIEEKSIVNFRSALWKLLLAVVLAGPSLWAQADRGVITGIVTDRQGAVVASAPVVIVNNNTGVVTNLRTTEAGMYSSIPLGLGNYSVSVEVPGFKKAVAGDITLRSGQTVRQDFVLELGTVTETVQVVGALQQLNTDNAQVSAAANRRYLNDLPSFAGGEVRLPERLLLTIPGYTPSRGSTGGWNSRINGGQAMAYENFLDGASFGSAADHNQTGERSVPLDAVEEVNVVQNTFSAQYGRTSGGFVEYTTRSGTSALHGSAFHYLQNDKLNTRGFTLPRPSIIRQNNWGFTVGGPVYIPKIYEQRNKTFFFFAHDAMDNRTPGRSSGFNTVPTTAVRAGDFTEILTGKVAGVDACGRQVLAGQVFDPNSSRDASTCGGPAGILVRDPFPGNIVPIRSQIAKNIQDVWPAPDREGRFSNSFAKQNQPWFDSRIYMTRLDHNPTDNIRLALTYNFNKRPRYIGCSGVGGCDGPMGDGWAQEISTHTSHLQYTHVLRPNLFTHTTFGYDYWSMPDNWLSERGAAPRLGIRGIPHAELGGFPGVTFDSTYGGWSRSYAPTFQSAARWQIVNNTTYVVNRHALKWGIDIRHISWATGGVLGDAGVYNFRSVHTGAFDAAGNPIPNTGDPYASFRLGQVSSSSWRIPAFPAYQEEYISPWINNEWKATDRLTLTLGLRWEFQTPRTAKHDQYSSFDPTIPNPGAGGALGAYAFAGRNGQPRTLAVKMDKSALGPRFGFAYRVGERTVVRGGYGIYYSGITMGQWLATPAAGFGSNMSVSDLTNGREAIFFWDNGFPQSAIKIPPFIDPTIQNGSSALYMSPWSLTLPRYQNWTFAVQRQLGENMLLDVAYVANHGTRLVAGDMLGAMNQNHPALLEQYPAGLLTSDINSPTATAAGIRAPWEGFRGTVAQALRPFPQYTNVSQQNSANGMSTFNSLQVRLDKNFSHGLQMRGFWVWSKMMGNGANNGVVGSIGNTSVSVYRMEKAVDSDHVPHVFSFTYSYGFPFGRGRKYLNNNRVLDLILGGWNLGGIHRYESGRPLNITMTNIYGGILFNGQRRPDRVAGANGIKDHSESDYDIVNHRYLNRDAWATPAAGTLGTAPRRELRGFASYYENLSLYKAFAIREELALRFGCNANNILNRHRFNNPDTNFSNGANFGRITGAGDSRRLELYLKLEF